MTEFSIENMPILGRRVVAEQMRTSLPTTALRIPGKRKHWTLAYMFRDLPLDGNPLGCDRSDKKRLWGLRLRAMGRGNMLVTVENACMPISTISILISVGLFAVCIFSLFGSSPAFYLGGMGLCVAAVGFGTGEIGRRAMEINDGWVNEFKTLPSQYTNSFTQCSELKSFVRKVQEESELKQGDIESYLSQEDNLALLRLHAIIRCVDMDELKYVVLDGDARELLVRAGAALESAHNGSSQNKTMLITGQRLNNGNHAGREAS